MPLKCADKPNLPGTFNERRLRLKFYPGYNL
jgi:hypothetical protein